jgi:hypothetical protein
MALQRPFFPQMEAWAFVPANLSFGNFGKTATSAIADACGLSVLLGIITDTDEF